MLADLAVGNQTKYDQEPFSASRFKNKDYDKSKTPEEAERSRL